MGHDDKRDDFGCDSMISIGSELVGKRYLLYLLCVLPGQPTEKFYLTGDEMGDWAAAVCQALSYAEFDAAILRQLLQKGTSEDGAIRLLRHVREGRPERMGIPAIPCLQLAPCVSGSSGDPYLRLESYDKVVGQWNPNDARSHMLGLLEASSSAEIDTHLLHTYVSLGLDPSTATQAVNDLQNYRANWSVVDI